MDGLLLIDKPVGISSFDIIRSLRRTTGVRKIGHAGTLDPAADGLMLMLFGTACKKADQFSKLDKTYIAEITLGATSATGDSEGPIIPVIPTAEEGSRPNSQIVQSVLDSFVGTITQTPSIYSAIKINGQEAYKLARKGQTPDMPKRLVTIYSISMLGYDYPKLSIEVSCSSGTYIRTLAEDIGVQLGTGAYLSALRRTKVGEYRADQAISLDTDAGIVIRSLRPLES